MNLAQMLSTYITVNLMVIVGFGGLKGLFWAWGKVGRSVSARTELKIHYRTLSVLLILGGLLPWLPQQDFFQPVAKVWSASSLKKFDQVYAERAGGEIVSPVRNLPVVSADHVSIIWLVIAFFALTIGLWILGRDLYFVYRIRRRSFQIRRLGRVRIFANNDVTVPFSYWLGHADVVVPLTILARADDYRMVLLHELQHHRQGDTHWIYMMWILKVLCGLNPFIFLWNRWLSEIQEYACDEALVDHKKVDSQAYARCLVEVAQTAFSSKCTPVCATGLTFLIERHILKRRIEKMFNRKATTLRRSIGAVSVLVLTGFMVLTAFAAQGVVQDRRVSLAQAQVMAKAAQSKSGFPIVVNDLVLKQLNRYIGTPDGREFMRQALQRMEIYRGLVEGKISSYGLPMELMAIPIIESGYENLPDQNKYGWGAGLWMFIASTARNYGLRVDSVVDERTNETLLTDAAMRYLQANNLRFKDWHLAVLAYNVGESNVQKAIVATGSRDAWTLVKQGYQNDRDYLPRVMAAILIMRNPDSVK